MIAAASSSDDGSDSGHGGPGGGASIEAATARALQDALRGYLLAADATAEAALVTAFRALAGEARARRIPAERLVILIKSLWYELPDLRTTNVSKQQELLAQAVTLCIRAYYADAESR